MAKLKVEVHSPLLENAPDMGKGVKRNKKLSAKIPQTERHINEPTHDEMLKQTARAAHRAVVHEFVSGRASEKQLHASRARMKKAIAGCKADD